MSAEIDQQIKEIRELLDQKYDKSGGTISGNVVIGGNLNVGGTVRGPRVHGAIWNDLAELFYCNEENVESGTLMMLDVTAEEEIYKTAVKGEGVLIGVKSDEYAFLMGGNLKEADHTKDMVPISLAGRVFTKIVGPIRAGEAITISEIPGVGCVADDPEEDIVGIAVETNLEEGIKLVRIKIR